MRAVMRGFAKEDVSQGHSLMADSAARMIQLQFVGLAAKYQDSLRNVLHTSGDADHRAFAAEVLAYSANKQSIVGDLVYAMRDPASDVRNNATRALALIAMYAQQHPELKIKVPYDPFIDLLNSLAWTDRNKSSLALMQLTESRDPALLAALKARAFDSIVDIAQWTNPGHAMAGIFMLGRMAGMPDRDIIATFERGERDKIIDAARKVR
jgi:HEAT repeats